MEVIVNDDQLSLAIGKKGQNVRLASKLTGWKIDISSESEVEKTSKKIIDDLVEKLKISEILARVLHDEYLRDPKDIAKLTPEEMNKITSISVEDCKRIIEEAKSIVSKPEVTPEPVVDATEENIEGPEKGNTEDQSAGGEAE
jgi:N utilization substance protein A